MAKNTNNYGWAVFKIAWQDTKLLLEFNAKTVAIAVFLALISFVIQWKVAGWAAMKEQLFATVIYTVLPVGLFALGLLIFNYLRAPLKVIKEREQAIAERDNKICTLTQQLHPPNNLQLFFDPNDSNCIEYHTVDDYAQEVVEHYRVGITNIGKTGLSDVRVTLDKCIQIDTQGEHVLGIRPDILEPLGKHHDGCFEVPILAKRYVNVLTHYSGFDPDDEELLYIQFLEHIKYARSNIPRNADNIVFKLELIAVANNTAPAKSTLEVATRKDGIPTIRLVSEASL